MVINDHTGTAVNLYEISQETGIVIFTYPAASTPGCNSVKVKILIILGTKQVCFFRDSYQSFTNLGYKVFGLSNDTSKKNNTFYTKQKLNYPLLSDPEAKLIKFLGANNGSAHKAIRSAFILKDGKLVHSNIKVGPEPSKDWALKMIA
ncbi:hypothetical protein DSO57_1036028 [Entomophthora muscae]|uniref:Uncharacterized protein n=1 Tax=Entomophthora muscae TaxID=34485 RepID=A0ACC2U8E2_9FUNG|nr:hypothetical protein DSO57_1036028 [Entomophthora muscae]